MTTPSAAFQVEVPDTVIPSITLADVCGRPGLVDRVTCVRAVRRRVTDQPIARGARNTNSDTLKAKRNEGRATPTVIMRRSFTARTWSVK